MTASTATPARPPYTVAEAASLLGINPRTAYNLIDRGEFPVPTFRIGAQHKVPRRPLDALVSGEAR